MEELRLACAYIPVDPASSLTKSRVVMEKVLVEIYTNEMGKVPKTPLLGDMLADNQFTRRIERRVVTRMNSIRDMGNLGPHGYAVEPDDAARVLDDLCTVVDWYLQWRVKTRSHFPSRSPSDDQVAAPAGSTEREIHGGHSASAAGVGSSLGHQGTQGRRPRREVPALLHYHCDRFDQENQIEEALKRSGRDGPLVFIVHGDEYQCHDKFLERLSLISLPRILGLDPDRSGVKEYLINFPSALTDCRKFREQLMKNLGLRVLKRSTATVDEIAEVFARLSWPIVVQARLLTDEWVRGGRVAIISFLDFWREWPVRDAKFHPLVFLIVTYQRRSGLGLLSWYHRIVRQRANARLRRFLDSLTRHSNPTGVVVLDELRGITQNDLEVWAQDMYTQQFCGERDLLSEVRGLCRRPGFRDPEGRIAMELIAAELRRLLDTAVQDGRHANAVSILHREAGIATVGSGS
jgi:hypothetical protein